MLKYIGFNHLELDKKEVPPSEASTLGHSKHKHAGRQDLLILKGSMSYAYGQQQGGISQTGSEENG